MNFDKNIDRVNKGRNKLILRTENNTTLVLSSRRPNTNLRLQWATERGHNRVWCCNNLTRIIDMLESKVMQRRMGKAWSEQKWFLPAPLLMPYARLRCLLHTYLRKIKRSHLDFGRSALASRGDWFTLLSASLRALQIVRSIWRCRIVDLRLAWEQLRTEVQENNGKVFLRLETRRRRQQLHAFRKLVLLLM